MYETQGVVSEYPLKRRTTWTLNISVKADEIYNCCVIFSYALHYLYLPYFDVIFIYDFLYLL